MNRIESNWVRFEFNSIPWLSRDITQISKKEIFVFAKIEKLHYTSRTNFQKRKFFADHFWIRFDLTQFDSIRFDLTQFDSNRFDSIQIRFRFGQFGFDSNSIRFRPNRISSIRIWFADHEFESFAEPYNQLTILEVC